MREIHLPGLFILLMLKLFLFSFDYRDLMNLILEKGHSRVPVYYEQPNNIIGLVLVTPTLMHYFHILDHIDKIFSSMVYLLLTIHISFIFR